jgi:hypothetical protein
LNTTSRTTIEIGWVSLWFSATSVVVFFLWVLLAAPTRAAYVQAARYETLPRAHCQAINCSIKKGEQYVFTIRATR